MEHMEFLPVRAIIFDKDGTLHDTEKVFLEAWRRAAEDLDVPDIERTVRDCTGVNLPDTAVYWGKKYPKIPFEATVLPAMCTLVPDASVPTRSSGLSDPCDKMRHCFCDGVFCFPIFNTKTRLPY